jgi:hypothetical protein
MDFHPLAVEHVRRTQESHPFAERMARFDEFRFSLEC